MAARTIITVLSNLAASGEPSMVVSEPLLDLRV